MSAPIAVSTLIEDVDQAVARRDEERRAENLRQVTGLFLSGAGGLGGAGIEVFDEVIGRLAAGAEAGARAELAERLADAPNAPPALVRRLAEDEIAVAAPLLARSNRLSDADLAAIAASKGAGHRLAITERAELGEAVTDALVGSGDRGVAHALACHPGARLSEASASALVERAGGDGTLRTLLVGRVDLAEGARARLVAGSGEAGDRAAPADRSLPALDLDRPDGAARLGRALAAVQSLADMRPLAEDDLVAFLAGGESAEAVCALALLASLPVSVTLRLFEPGRTDLLLLVARSQGWAWETAHALLAARAGPAPDPGLDAAYAGLEPATASRVLHALNARTRQARPEPRQIRSKVR